MDQKDIHLSDMLETQPGRLSRNNIVQTIRYIPNSDIEALIAQKVQEKLQMLGITLPAGISILEDIPVPTPLVKKSESHI